MRITASFLFRAFAISRLNSSPWLFDHAAASKSLRITVLLDSDDGAACPPWVRSHTANSCNNSRLDLGAFESQFAFHRFIHSV